MQRLAERIDRQLHRVGIHTLRAKLILLLILSMALTVGVAGVLIVRQVSSGHSQLVDQGFDRVREGLAMTYATRLDESRRLLNSLSSDPNVVLRLDSVAGGYDNHEPMILLRAHQRAITIRLARVGPAARALVVAYDRDGQPLSYFDGRGQRPQIGSFALRDPEQSASAQEQSNQTYQVPGQAAEAIRREDVGLPSGNEGAVWRVIGGEPVLAVSIPVEVTSERGTRRVGHIALFLGHVFERNLPRLLDGEIEIGWVMPDGSLAGALDRAPPPDVLADAPLLSDRNAGRFASDAGRYDTAERAGRVMQLPVEKGAPLFLALSISKDSQRAQARSAMADVLLAFVLSGLVVLPIGLWLARVEIIQPVASLSKAVRAMEAGDYDKVRLDFDDADEIGHLNNAFRDLALSLQQRERESSLWQAVFAKIGDAVFITDPAGKVLFVNKAFCEISGRKAEDIVGQHPPFLDAGLHDEAFYDELWSTLRSAGYWSGEVWDARADGTAYPQWLAMTAIRSEKGQGGEQGGEIANIVGIFNDISERKAQEERIHYLAHHDSLTGLPNRVLLNDRLNVAMSQANRDNHCVALLFIDLDRFKNINDSLGHAVGDGLLQAVAERLRRAVRGADTVCRVGGDEFIVVLHKVRRQQDAELVAEHILASLAPAARVGEHDLSITPSIGLSLYPGDASDAEMLIRTADVAMYHAKAQGRNNYQVYRPDMNEEAAENLSLEHALRLAVDRDEFELYYQPQIDIITRKLVGAEALIRWNSERFGGVSPAKFIPVAEESGLILQIGSWVLREACRQRAEWTREGIMPFPIAVNVSALQFRQPDFRLRVQEALQLYGVSPKELELELTESVVMHEADHTADTLAALKELGIALSIDDFGTGYSSLGYLKRLPIQKLKIDSSFVRNLETDMADRAIVEAIVSLGRSLKLQMIAEGVENRAVLGMLAKLGCHLAQGYHYCRPVPARAFVSWYRDFHKPNDGRLQIVA
ncbi:putative bifunctional diguanylate cyclase/phosphodiesterase [Uliginosibacterium sp. H1]|uniref:putative bifunctional diguanylate cyclase/phosphodiesterase n=1 Tax=Uliginosibacterium sp. H1 TaxID=3114757 RepID=UPI002E1919B1|nr:EAL domain-containing protein [Uliginosibacterium sp. H1]